MEFDFFYRSLRASILVVVLVACWGLLLSAPVWSLQIMVFGGWAIVNLYCLSRLLIVIAGQEGFFSGALWLTFNLGMVTLIVAACALFSHLKWLSVSAILLGMHLPLIVILLKGLGRLLTQSGDSTEPSLHSQTEHKS